MSSHTAHRPFVLLTSFTGEGKEYECLVAKLTTTPAPRFAVIDPTGAEKSAVLQKLLKEPLVRSHYAGRCVYISCDRATSAEVVIAHLISALGLESRKDTIGAVLDDLVNHGRTLIFLDNFDEIYSCADPEQQKATDAMLAALSNVDELGLIITLRNTPKPDRIALMINDVTCEMHQSEPPAGLSSLHERKVMTSALPQADGTSHAVVRGGSLILTSATTATTGPGIATGSYPERVSPQNSTRNIPSTLAASKVPPARPKVFHGRDKELERLIMHTIVPSTAPIGIIGPGGIGKTTLALKVLHSPRVKQHFGKERFFLTCEGANNTDDVLGQLASKLDVQRPQNTPLWPAVLEELRSRQRVLLLDNFESIWSPTDNELREASEVFLAQLAVLDELTLLVTTRGKLLPESITWTNADTAELDTLSSTAARQTFNDLTCIKPHILESELEENALTELLREVDFMPLAVVLLARLDDLPSSLLREWSEYYTAVLEADRHDGTRRELSVEVSIKISLAHLPAESAEVRPRQLLSVLGQLPAGLFPKVLSELGCTIPKLDQAAQHLLRHSLVYSGGHGELRMLSPVRHYVAESIFISSKTLSALDEIYLGVAKAHPAHARTYADGPVYDLELPNILNILTATVDRYHHGQLVWSILDITTYCENRNQPCLPLLQKILPRLDSVCEERAYCQRVIGMHHELAGEPHLAVPFYEQAIHLFEELGNKPFEALTRMELAVCLRYVGHEVPNEQIVSYENTVAAVPGYAYLSPSTPGEDDRMTEQRFRDAREVYLQHGDGVAVSNLSERILTILRERGDMEAYTTELEIVIALLEKTRPESPHLAQVKRSLAQRYIASNNNIDRAEELLIEGYAVMSQHNSRMGIAMITLQLALLRARQRHFSEGAELAEAASKMFREYGDARTADQVDNELVGLLRKHAGT